MGKYNVETYYSINTNRHVHLMFASHFGSSECYRLDIATCFRDSYHPVDTFSVRRDFEIGNKWRRSDWLVVGQIELPC
jgi:hypothetical protein